MSFTKKNQNILFWKVEPLHMQIQLLFEPNEFLVTVNKQDRPALVTKL